MKLLSAAEKWQDSDRLEEARKMLRFAHKMYKPRKVWCLCSGGNDSLTSTHIAMSTGLCDGVASINTTIGIRQTREHMQAVASRFNWPLRWLTPKFTYLDFCKMFGMPGPGRHDYVYAYLKERCVKQLARESKRLRRDRIMLVTGVRLSESDRRMGTAEPIAREGARLWVAPIINWDAQDQMVYMINNGIPRNQVKKILGISGECLCGAFAKPDERAKIAEHYPEAEAEIVMCEAAAAESGRPCEWGKRPKTKNLCQQCTRKNGDE